MRIIFIFIAIVFLIFKLISLDSKPKHDFSQLDIMEAISSSNDYKEYKKAFVTKTKELVDNERCTLEEIKEQGGWMYAPLRTNEIGGRQYFIHCGGTHNNNKIYLDISNYIK
jgi:hypothetical protein